MQHKLYIDGIRGIAVLAVIFFHANYSIFKGGFLGVDIFFVLSGFLIMASISSHVDNENFSFIHYYKKRFLRIVPAAFVTLLLVLVVGLLVLFPEELISLYENIYYILTIQSNTLAAKTIDYFGIGVEYKPLVHYWSLSIELQFYIFFPVLIFLFLKYHYEKTLLFVLLSILFISIGYATYNNSLSGNAKYFSTFMRLWEFALGASTFLLSKQYSKFINIHNKYLKHLSLLGILLVVSSIIIFDKTFNVPGITTLIPTIGVSLLLLFTNDHSYIGKILSLNPLRKIGIISYSLYLIHQPIFAFYRTIMDRDFYFHESLILIIITFFMGYFLWRYVEKTFQDKKQKYINYKIILIILLGLSILFISKNQMNKNPSEYILTDNIKNYLSYRYDNNPRLKECRIDNKIIVPENACKYDKETPSSTIALWGDSHLDQIAMPLSKELNAFGYKVVEFSVAGCPPIENVDIENKERKCYQNGNIILNYILSHDEYKDVVLFAYWNYYVTHSKVIGKESISSQEYELEDALQKTIDKLHKKGKRIHIIYPAPQMKVNPPFHKARLEKLFFENEFIIKISQEDYYNQSLKATKLLNSIPSTYNINKIYISELLKENNSYIANNNNNLFYRDNNHLSTQGGGSKVSPGIAKQIKKYIMDSIK